MVVCTLLPSGQVKLSVLSMNSLNYDEPRNVKNKAFPAAHVGTLARETTRLLAFLGHPKGASRKPCGAALSAEGSVVPLGKVPDLSVETRLATELAGRVITQRIIETGH